MKKMVLLGLLVILLSAGCVEQALYGGKATPLVDSAATPSVAAPTAAIPPELLEDQLDKSLEELEIVG